MIKYFCQLVQLGKICFEGAFLFLSNNIFQGISSITYIWYKYLLQTYAQKDWHPQIYAIIGTPELSSIQLRDPQFQIPDTSQEMPQWGCSGCTNPQIFGTSPFAPADFEASSTMCTRCFATQSSPGCTCTRRSKFLMHSLFLILSQHQ